MQATDIPTFVIFEESAPVVMARIRGHLGTNVTIASISAITLKVFVKSTGIQVGSTQNLTVATTVFDTLQTTALDPRWTLDATGYNFRDQPSSTLFPDGDVTYRAQYTLTPLTGAAFVFVVDFPTRDLLGQ